jgi:SPP1 family predicted phage head-tail adaptor
MREKIPTARELDQRLQLYPLVETRNTFGEVVGTYPDMEIEVWAKAEELDGADILIAQTFLSHLNVKFWIRYYAPLNSGYQVAWRGQRFNITEVLPHGRRAFNSMIASEAK